MMQLHQSLHGINNLPTYLPGYVPIPNKIHTMQNRKALFPPTECLSPFWAFREECPVCLFAALCRSLSSMAGSLPSKIIARRCRRAGPDTSPVGLRAPPEYRPSARGLSRHPPSRNRKDRTVVLFCNSCIDAAMRTLLQSNQAFCLSRMLFVISAGFHP